MLILASGSPRRRELLASAGVDCTVLRVDIDETPSAGELPTDYIARMVSAKAKAAVQALQSDPSLLKISETAEDTQIVLTADTIGVLPDGRSVLIKPEDKADAFAMWQQMSGVNHQIWTAVQATQVKKAADDTITVTNTVNILEKTDVQFVALDDAMMERYWQSGEPQDKAGGYAIQGGAAAWVARIDGSYTNVVGLPLAQTLTLLQQLGHQV
ncbi:Maf family protein [Psychrobacter aestuarii]|uniref:dTTP/UTP pyrophosphatase n=1 Tax=Psychrobacter aestuarii TaxID=556327 RepID=A0ABN0VVB2_9GAMM|nr:Maf family protein [Psychrobacter aestuarii]